MKDSIIPSYVLLFLFTMPRTQAATTAAQRPVNWEHLIFSYYEEIGSLTDPISVRPNAVAIDRRFYRQGASRHHGGAATRKLGTASLLVL